MKSRLFLSIPVLFIFNITLLITNPLQAQNITITDDDVYLPDASAMLDVKSISKGMLIPRMDSSQRVGIISPATGLLVFDTDANAFYYYDGSDWLNLTTNVISPSSAGMNDALFSVVNTNGDTVFAVYPEAVEINVGDGVGKANKGGFAVGGLASGKLPQKQFLVVSPDSVRIYVDTASSKANKGGFAVGGLASGKAARPIFFTVSDDSVRIYLDTTNSSKANKGGFAVGGLASGKAAGPTLFTVSDDSIRMYIDQNTAKANKGGFAVGGLASGKAGANEFLRVTADSVRIYIDTTTGSKANKGGFAVGGLASGKAIGPNLFTVSDDSIRIYIDQNPTKANKGGFAVGGLASGKSPANEFLRVTADSTRISVNDSTAGFSVATIGNEPQDFMNITSENYFIGHQSGESIAPGADDIGRYNSFMGYKSGVTNSTGKKNVFLGYYSGYTNNADFNVFIGNESGKANSSGEYNTYIGYRSGLLNTSGQGNTFIGFQSGLSNVTGYHNTFLGYNSGIFCTGNGNIYLGYGAGQLRTSGEGNVCIGFQAGGGVSTTGYKNVFIGYQAGIIESGSEKLYIDNSSTTLPLIWGDFSSGNEEVRINGDFFVTGSAGGNGNWNAKSDLSLKSNIMTISGALNKVLMLRGVTFNWKDTEEFGVGNKIGFIAQEVDKVLPEVVNKTDKHYFLQYGPITALLVEALKEQQKIISKQQEIINSVQEDNELLKKSNSEMKIEIEKIKSLLNISD